MIESEKSLHDEHRVPDIRIKTREEKDGPGGGICMGFYEQSDMGLLQDSLPLKGSYTHSLRSIDELLERDKQREEDGFPRKIRIGRMVRPGKGAKEKIILVPTTVEEKFIHDSRKEEASGEGAGTGGSGDGEEGDVIGQEPVHGTDGAGSGGAGQGEGGEHETESNAYDLGRILTEHFELPNLKEKGKKRSFTKYTYDLTDRHRGFGQVLDKKATLRKLIETNIHLGHIPDTDHIDSANLLVSPGDMIYRVLSRQKDYESQAMVFFVRDYSGSMTGQPTEIVVSTHVMIYSWLMYQYEKQVETRFILHDTEAKEVPDFYTYYNSTVAGGTRVVSAIKMVNDIVENEGLERHYNIYVFHGTDGDDWDSDGKQTIPELERMLRYCNRMGITIASGISDTGRQSAVEHYIGGSGLLESHAERIRLDAVKENSSEERVIKGIKHLIS